MDKWILALAALGAAGSAAAQTPAGEGVQAQFHGLWGTSARACAGDENTPGRIEINNSGYTGASGNAAVLKRGRIVGGIQYFDVVFSADGDRQWAGRLALRLRGNVLAISAITRGRTRSANYVRCRG